LPLTAPPSGFGCLLSRFQLFSTPARALPAETLTLEQKLKAEG
jgi:hypothetical protein